MAHSIEITSIDNQIPLLLPAEKDEIEEEQNIVDHLIEIRETNGQDRSGLQTTNSAEHFFDEKFKDLDNSSINSTTIFKVTVGLRESNTEAYKPKLISIGPYHYKDPEFRSMEKYKLMYLKRFLRRKGGIDMQRCINAMKELKDDALKCYDYDYIKEHDSDIFERFSEMLLLDGCFVVEYMRECGGNLPDGEDMIIKENYISSQVHRDLLLVENQLPFFVLAKLYDMTKVENESFTELVKDNILLNLPKMDPASFLETVGNEKNIKHLLHVAHMSCHPSDQMKKTSLPRHNSSMEVENSRKSLCCKTLQIMRSKEMPKDKDHITSHTFMPNATELSQAGVSFVKVGYSYRSLETDIHEDRTSLFDIKFDSGLMSIPCFKIADDTETLLRNFIAYEQQSSDVHPQYFSDFAVFMDLLIDSDKDVSLLRRNGIIENWMGEDKEVASLFNKIGNGVTVYSDFYYNVECMKAIQHCEKTLNRMMASLRHNYFSNTWVGTSTVAAIILLILTTTQTILAFTGSVR